MRNLKKILALVLALVMSLSLMATAGAAETTAADTGSKYQTAIDVLKGIEVVKGDEKGDRPADPITRAEVAALLYRIATADVKDAQAAIHTGQGFTDVNANDWYAGYISYCYIAEIIKGNPNGTFEPDANINGYATLAMILRAMGYGKNGEFVGDGWEIRTASTAKQIGILNGISDTQLSGNATRELVFEILFRAILTDEVKFTALNPYNYESLGTTLGGRNFGLEKVSGVVMANEWANLNENGDSVLAAGTTQLKLEDGKTYTVNQSTDLDAVGLTYNAYVANGEGSVKKALTLEEGSNAVAFNEGKATGPDTDYSANREWASIQKLADEKSISIKDSTEFFVDYDQAWNEDVTSDYRISYAIAKTKVADVPAWTTYVTDLQVANQTKYPGHSIESRTIAVNWDINDDKVVDNKDTIACWYIAIRPDKLINTIDQAIMEEIFADADRLGNNVDNTGSSVTQNYAIGEVYVGTTSMKDYSDDMSWKNFKAEYFADTLKSRRFTSAENGESLRVIDNNNDGTAEYVLKITYTMDQVTGTYKDAPEMNGFRVAAKYKDNNLSMDGEFPVGTVVVYSVIDNKLTMWPAEVLTDTINTKTFKDITVTTAGGEVKGQSGIENLTGMDQLIMNMNDKTEYNMYLDRFGFVRAYALAQGSKYALLTEMYPGTNQNYNYVQTARVTAEMKMGDADVDEYNVVNRDGSVFYSSYAWTSRNTRYQNTDLNYLQPAIAHLGLATQYEGATTNAIANPGTAYTLVDWARTVWAMLTEREANVADGKPATGSTTDYGVFEYGSVKYDANNKTGQLAVDEANSFSFTNVAAYTLDDDNNVTLSTAAKLFIDQNGEQVYYDSTNWTTKVTQSSYVAAVLKGIASPTDAQIRAARTDFQDLVNGTNDGGNNGGKAVRYYPVYAEDYVQLNREDVKAGKVHYTIPTDYTTNFNASNNGYVDATVNTEFYIVMPDDIMYKVGYGELPTIKGANVRAAYAVAKNTTAADNGRDYWVADVIVIEVGGLEHAYDSISLMYNNPFEMSNSVRWIDSLNNKWKVYQPDSDKLAEMQVVPSSVVNPDDPDSGWGNQAWYGNDYGFYGLKQVELQEEGELTAKVVELISKDYNKYGIYAGTVQRIKGILNSSGYIDVDLSGNPYDGTLTEYPNVKHVTARNVPVYRVDGGSVSGLTLSESDAYNEVYLGDQIIWVCEQGSADNFGKVAFIVDLGSRTVADDGYKYDAAQWLLDEYAAIIAEQNKKPPVVTRSAVTFDTALTGTEEITFSYGEGDYAVNKTIKAGDADTTVSFMVPDDASGNTFHFTAKVSAGVALAAIVPVAPATYKLANSSYDAATSTYTIYMVKVNLANAPSDGTAPQADEAVGTIYTVAAAKKVAADAAAITSITDANVAEAVALLDVLKEINAAGNKITTVTEVTDQLDTTKAGSLAKDLADTAAAVTTAKTGVDTAISTAVSTYGEDADVKVAVKNLQDALNACKTVSEVTAIYDKDGSGLVTTNPLVKALTDAVAAAQIKAAEEAGNAAAAAALKTAKDTAKAAVTTAMTTGGADVSAYPAVKAAAKALTDAIDACKVVEGTDDADGNPQVDAVDTYYDSGSLVGTNAKVAALTAAITKARADAAALTALTNAKAAAKAKVETWIDSTIGGDAAKKTAVKAVQAVKDATEAVTDAIDACTTPDAVSAIVLSAGTGAVVESQTQVAALKAAITAAVTAYDELAGKKTAAKAAIDASVLKGFGSVSAVGTAKTALESAIDACVVGGTGNKDIATYWNGTALQNSTEYTALVNAVTTALGAAKTSATATVNGFKTTDSAYKALDATKQAVADTGIATATTKALAAIEAAGTKDAIDSAVSTFNTEAGAAVTAAANG